MDESLEYKHCPILYNYSSTLGPHCVPRTKYLLSFLPSSQPGLEDWRN